MSQESLINSIELASIALAGILGIAGTVTETKDKKGKLTKWGWVALLGIIITNSLSFFQNYFQKENEMEQRLENAEREENKAKEELKMYLNQIEKLTQIVRKSDSSLRQQQTLQNQTGELLTDMGQSVSVQNSILNQSQTLANQQKVVAANIDRTLNPLLPFKISMNLAVKGDSTATWLFTQTRLLQEKIKEVKNILVSPKEVNALTKPELDYLQMEGIVPLVARPNNYIVNKGYRFYNDLLHQFTKLKIGMAFSRIQNKAGKLIQCEVPKEELQEKSVTDQVQITFNAVTQTYYFTLPNLPVRVSSDLPTGSYGLKDLENSDFSLVISGSPGLVLQSDILFKFPPDFSRINFIKGAVTGKNTVTNYLDYTYSFKTVTHFGY